jgi:NADP-dependent 3-hydroxy acid dehydrogenase YdfG
MSSEKPGAGQTALVTGASMGIGVDLAECFAKDGYDLILAARSAAALQEVAARLSKTENQRVVITGKGNHRTARMVPFLPRAMVLKMVRNLQSPAAS